MWYDGYSGERCLLIEEGTDAYSPDELKVLLDKKLAPYYLPVKGTQSVCFLFSKTHFFSQGVL